MKMKLKCELLLANIANIESNMKMIDLAHEDAYFWNDELDLKEFNNKKGMMIADAMVSIHKLDEMNVGGDYKHLSALKQLKDEIVKMKNNQHNDTDKVRKWLYELIMEELEDFCGIKVGE